MAITTNSGNAPTSLPPSAKKAIAAATIGNALEWYDIIVYGIFAATIAKVFFPTDDPAVGLMITLGTFGVSFLIRPLGAIVLGAYADRAGRKKSLMVSIWLMMGATAVIAFMPNFATIGLAAPILVILARLVQGFAAGGEFGSATAYLVEQSPNRRGFMGSWQFASQGVSTLLAAGFGAILFATLNNVQMEDWGWRLPFIFGLLIGPVGIWIRRTLDESPEFEARRKEVESASADVNTPAASPVSGTRPGMTTAHAPGGSVILQLLRSQKVMVLLAMGSLALSTALNYMILYMPTYAITELKLPAAMSFAATAITGVVLVVLTPLVGILSDRIGHVKMTSIAGVVILLAIIPLFHWLSSAPSVIVLLTVMFILGVLKSCYYGALPALMAGCFPTETRSTGLALSYNLGVMAFGGFTPAIIAWLIALTGNELSPAFYIVLIAVFSLAILFALRRKTGMK
ncbi:MFS transporter [Pseudarthrobacter psychrotolerans]|uniref:Putative proline/betaine transporter n=1 Tax=Pseudarthrobacter psychrotolerans TaxID=2697569 RepID=A0A6P1NI71_9MICC|nr:MFS transporter [Pseudarthrobacter psychrotolerans]QHK18507.1 MFS transporter [Pseudarthrobacter psychrotolerans]